MKSVTHSRRQLLRALAIAPLCVDLRAAKGEFWDSKDPASWTSQEKDILLYQSPWAQQGMARMEIDTRKRPGYGNTGMPGSGMPDLRPGTPPGGVPTVPIGGEKIPKAPNPDQGHPVEFRVLARWEMAKPVRLAGGPEVPEMTGQFYVIRLRGLPLMPPPKKQPDAPPDEPAPDPNEAILQGVKDGSQLERKGKAPISCSHLFKGSGDTAMEVLLFFPRGADPITLADKLVTLESRFALFHLSIRFPLREMMYRGELSL